MKHPEHQVVPNVLRALKMLIVELNECGVFDDVARWQSNECNIKIVKKTGVLRTLQDDSDTVAACLCALVESSDAWGRLYLNSHALRVQPGAR